MRFAGRGGVAGVARVDVVVFFFAGLALGGGCLEIECRSLFVV